MCLIGQKVEIGPEKFEKVNSEKQVHSPEFTQF
jgi:hypothetical protein